MYKIYDKSINVIKNVVENWREKFKAFADLKIKISIFHRDSLTTPQFVIEKLPLSYLLRKCSARCKFIKSRGNINQFTYIDDIRNLPKMKNNCRHLYQKKKKGF